METIPEGDYERGRRIFKLRCAHCHHIDCPTAKMGPTLHHILDRSSGCLPGFIYSSACKSKGIKWTREALFEFLGNPKRFMPGTTMLFAGLKKPQDRADVIKYIEIESQK